VASRWLSFSLSSPERRERARRVVLRLVRRDLEAGRVPVVRAVRVYLRRRRGGRLAIRARREHVLLAGSSARRREGAVDLEVDAEGVEFLLDCLLSRGDAVAADYVADGPEVVVYLACGGEGEEGGG